MVSEKSIAQFLQAAGELQEDAKSAARSTSKFTLAYEGMFSVVMAVLEFHGVRPGDASGHRATSIGRAAADLGLSSAQQSVLLRLHDVRNRVTYRKPIPPVTKSDAEAMQSILTAMFEAARVLISNRNGTGT